MRHEPAVFVHFKMAAARWSWSNEMIEALIYAIKDYKNLCESNAIDFNADKVTLYEELRKRMAKNVKEDFGPEQALQPPELFHHVNTRQR